MFFASTAPSLGRRHVYPHAGRSLERFLDDALQASRHKASAIEQDDKSFTLTFDVPGVAREQLVISIEGNIVRVQSKEGASRQYKAAYELPQDIDIATSEARLEHGVLTLKLGKVVPVSTVTELAIS